MKKKMVWHVVGVLILGLALLAVSCGGPPAVEEPAKEEPAVEEAAVEEPAAEEPTAEEPVTTGGQTAISHPLEGRDDCLQCHGESAFKPFPADHSGRSNDTCTTCHKTAE